MYTLFVHAPTLKFAINLMLTCGEKLDELRIYEAVLNVEAHAEHTSQVSGL